MSRLAQAALTVFKAAPPGFFNSLTTSPVDATTDSLNGIMYNNFTTTPKTVSTLSFYSDGGNVLGASGMVGIYDPLAPGAGAGGVVYGVLTTPALAAIAATAYSKKIPLAYAMGCVYLYNAGIGMIQPVCSVATTLQIN